MDSLGLLCPVICTAPPTLSGAGIETPTDTNRGIFRPPPTHLKFPPPLQHISRNPYMPPLQEQHIVADFKHFRVPQVLEGFSKLLALRDARQSRSRVTCNISLTLRPLAGNLYGVAAWKKNGLRVCYEISPAVKRHPTCPFLFPPPTPNQPIGVRSSYLLPLSPCPSQSADFLFF